MRWIFPVAAMVAGACCVVAACGTPSSSAGAGDASIDGVIACGVAQEKCCVGSTPCHGGLTCAGNICAAIDVDAGSDAADDTGPDVDGNAPDAFDPFPGTWTPLPGSPGCPVLVASDPATSVGPITWAPCVTQPSGCQQMVIDWSSDPGMRLGYPGPEVVRLVSGLPYLVYYRMFPRYGELLAWIAVVQPLRGAPVLAVGNVFNLDAGQSCIASAFQGERGVALILDQTLAWTPWGSPSSFSSTLFDGGFGQYPLESVAVGTGPFYVGLYPAGLDVFDPDAGSRTLAVASDGGWLPAQTPAAVPDGALVFNGVDLPNGISLVRADGTSTPLVIPQSPYINGFAIDRANGYAISWVECASDSPMTGCILWSSPYATSAAAMAPRMVAKLQDVSNQYYPGTLANAGVVLNVSLDFALVTRLSDGQSWQIQAPAGIGFGYVAWVDDAEVWIGGVDPQYPSVQLGFVRFDRSTLGAPTVPSGL